MVAGTSQICPEPAIDGLSNLNFLRLSYGNTMACVT
jgi:hypothetical protein